MFFWASASTRAGRRDRGNRQSAGLPEYSQTPRKTSSGKAYSAVHSSEDLSFEEKAPEAKIPEVMAANGGDTHRIKYYRNPMGLPDKSPTPKKDNMGMDYLPVYEGDEDDDSSVNVSAR